MVEVGGWCAVGGGPDGCDEGMDGGAEVVGTEAAAEAEGGGASLI